MVLTVGGLGEAAFLRASCVLRISDCTDGLQIAPGIDVVGFSPAVAWTGGESGSGLSRGDAIEGIVPGMIVAERWLPKYR